MTKKFFTLLLLPATCLAQNVGIGISPTKARLEINGAVGLTTAIFGGDGAGISFQQNNPAIGFNQYYTDVNRNMAIGGGWVQYLDMGTGSLNFDSYPQVATANSQNYSSTRRLTMRQNGNVSVNATEATTTLFVGGANLNLPAAIFRGSQYNSLFYESPAVNLLYRNTFINGGKDGSLVLLNDKLGGNLLIGGGTTKVGINTDPTDILEVKQVNGRGLALINPSFAYWEFFVEKNSTENASDMYVYYNGGNLGNFYQGDGKYYYYSDRRLKTTIEPLAPALAGLMALRPCEYEIKYNNPGHAKSIGLIAQEALAVFPEITGHITGNDLGYPGLTDLYTMNYDALGTLAIKAIQEQQQNITVLKSQIATLKQRVSVAEQAFTANHKLIPSN
ncbi:MAG: tail fiber domain-containing protein [Chitinophagaceae bacterium]